MNKSKSISGKSLDCMLFSQPEFYAYELLIQ